MSFSDFGHSSFGSNSGFGIRPSDLPRGNFLAVMFAQFFSIHTLPGTRVACADKEQKYAQRNPLAVGRIQTMGGPRFDFRRTSVAHTRPLPRSESGSALEH